MLHVAVSNVPRHEFLAIRVPVLASPPQLQCPMNLSANAVGEEHIPAHTW